MGIILSASPIFAQTDQLSGQMARFEQAKKSKNRDSLAIICADLSDYYTYRNNDSLLHYAEMGLKYADKNSPNPYLHLLANIGYYYNATGKSHACVEKHLFALREAQRVNAPELTLGDICSSLGVSYRRTDKTDSAALCYKQALTHYDAAGDEGRDEIPFLLTNIAILYTNTHRLDEAEHYIR